MPHIQAGNDCLACLRVATPANHEAKLTIRSASAGGGQVAAPVQVTLAPGTAYWREYTQIFSLAGSVTWNGSITVESTITGVIAEVSYGNSFGRSAYALTS